LAGLEKKSLREARIALSEIVGRETKNLETKEIVRATVESVAESTADGIIAPLFYLILGGPVLAIAYKAVNTLDSMVGYKNEKYKDFGRFAAKFDDLANFIPARISAVILPLAAFFCRKNIFMAIQTIKKDRRKHPSPNSGFPEAAVAGALGIQLGGMNYYQGVASQKPFIGSCSTPLKAVHIKESLMICHMGTLLFILAVVMILKVT